MAQKLVIKNIGLLLSGKMEDPIFDGDSLIALDGKIAEWRDYFDMATFTNAMA